MDWALTGGSWFAIISLNAAVAGALGRSRLNRSYQRALAERERERVADTHR